MKSLASFQTRNASRYLNMLCTHFGKKVDAGSAGEKGWVEFPFGRCDMTADDSQLEMQAMAEDQPLLDLVIRIVTSHLERFAFRENPVLDWQKPSK